MSPWLSERRIASFWPLQIGGWILYASAIAVSYIPFWAMHGAVAQRATILLSTFLVSFLLRTICRFLWQRRPSLFAALSICSLLSYIFGTACAALGLWVSAHFADDKSVLTWSTALTSGVGAAFTLTMWCAFYFGIRNYLNAAEQRTRLLAFEAAAREAQLRALRYQLQPHFLFNTLNAISALVVSQQPQAATEMIAKLASLLRHALSSPEVHSVALREELDVVREYLSVEEVRFGSRLRVTFDISEASESAEVPRFLLQPLAENAIRHGIGRCPEGGEIMIRAETDGVQLRIVVENDRPPASEEQPDQGLGVGLANTRSRLSTLYGEHRAEMTALGHAARFSVSLRLPFNLEGLA